jgi:hypothetical protein
MKKFKSKKTIYKESSENYLDILVNKIKLTKDHKKLFNKLTKFEKYVLSYYKTTGFERINRYLHGEKVNIFTYPNMGFNSMPNFSQMCEPEVFDLLYFNNSDDIKLSEYPEYSKKMTNLTIKLINTIDNIFNKPIIEKFKDNETILYRGIDFYSKKYKDYKINDEIHIKTFMSCSLDMNIASSFSGECCIYKITNLKDVPYIYLPWTDEYDNYYTNKYNFIENDSVYDPLEEFELLLPRGLKFKIINIEKLPSTNKSPITKFSNMKQLYKKIDINKAELKKEIMKIMPTIGVITLEYIGMKQEAIPVYIEPKMITVNINVNRINFLKNKK